MANGINEMNIQIMSADDLARYAIATTDLEKVLLARLIEITDEGGDYQTALSNTQDAIADLQQEEAEHAETKEKLEELQALKLEDERWIAQQDDELKQANQRITELSEELAATIT